MKRPIILALVLLLLVSMACSFGVNLPNVQVKTGPTETMNVNEPLPAGNNTQQIEISMGAGKLSLAGGANGLMDGTITYNVAGWKPVINRGTNSLAISQERVDNLNIPSKVENTWDLQLNNSVPLDLTVKAGAYEGSMNLTGLHLHSLSITDGAAKTDVRFDQPNQEVMSLFEYKTGASQVILTGLANANFQEMTFDSGAGDYTLDFTGTLQQSARVSIKSGVSQITIIIPRGTSAQVTNDSKLTTVSTQGTWSVNGTTYETAGGSNVLTIDVQGGVGNVKLIQK